MKAIVRRRYGSPDVMKLEECPVRNPGPHEVLIKIRAAAGNPADWHILRGQPFLMRLIGFGLVRPKHRILGADVAGIVEAIGSGVTRFSIGDAVFGDLVGSGWGAFAEYACAHEEALVLKPENLTFEQAAAVPLAALTGLQGLRDAGGIQRGNKVLINGASGGVGSFAVQIAKAFGAEVTGVASTKNLDLVRTLGADNVLDYTREDFTRQAARYDLIFDTAAFRPVRESLHALTPHGTYVLVGGDFRHFPTATLLGAALSVFGGKKVRVLTSKPNPHDLAYVKTLIEEGKVMPLIGNRYSLAEVPDAMRQLELGHTRGKLVIAV
jgi:NADPH:quinone reductase-like Zn-dependent oxidoreductase